MEEENILDGEIFINFSEKYISPRKYYKFQKEFQEAFTKEMEALGYTPARNELYFRFGNKNKYAELEQHFVKDNEVIIVRSLMNPKSFLVKKTNKKFDLVIDLYNVSKESTERIDDVLDNKINLEE